MESLKKIVKFGLKIVNAAKRDVQRTIINQIWPILPEGINMNANDICNSKCVMCNIWKQTKDFEFSPEQLQTILNDPLYKKVKYVGITGGEPTLRDDLPELYLACIKALPSLEHLSIITNGIKDQIALSRILEIKKICDNHKIVFSAMVSLDGVEGVHDAHRGRQGNFDSAMRLYNGIKDNGIDVSFGCTVTKGNLYGMNELLAFTKANNMKGRFRIGEFINRLYITEEENGKEIRNFNREETYYLLNFFHKLSQDFTNHESYRRNYRNIVHMLDGGKRQMACPHHDRAVQLDSRGVMHYCAPKSPSIGSGLAQSSLSNWKNNIDKRKDLLKNHCDNCIHDYLAEVTLKELYLFYKGFFWSWFNETSSQLKLKVALLRLASIPFFFFDKISSRKSVLITGWYGTETTGDKAILGGIVDKYKISHPGHRIVIASMFPFVTRKTIEELNIEASVVDTRSSGFIYAALRCREVAFGGGPLMDLDALSISLYAFEMARMTGARRTIFGCGIGPLRNEKYKSIVKQLIAISTSTLLRDDKSVQWVTDHKLNPPILKNIGDPSIDFIDKTKASAKRKNKKPILACYLREYPLEYTSGMSEETFLNVRNQLNLSISNYIKQVADQFNLDIVFYSMHTFHIGGDDRIFNRELMNSYFKDRKCTVIEENSNVIDIVDSMLTATKCITMRFHSCVFAQTLGADYTAIDYTSGGKIYSFLEEHDALHRMLSVDELIHENYSLPKVGTK